MDIFTRAEVKFRIHFNTTANEGLSDYERFWVAVDEIRSGDCPLRGLMDAAEFNSDDMSRVEAGQLVWERIFHAFSVCRNNGASQEGEGNGG